MPLIKSAKKKLRQDKQRQKRNSAQKDFLKEALKKARKDPSAEAIQTAVIATDKAVKNHLIHKNKAARIKSSLVKLLSQGKKEEKPPVKETPAKKKAPKKTTKASK